MSENFNNKDVADALAHSIGKVLGLPHWVIEDQKKDYKTLESLYDNYPFSDKKAIKWVDFEVIEDKEETKLLNQNNNTNEQRDSDQNV